MIEPAAQPREADPSRRRPGDKSLFRAAVAIAVAPVLIAAVRNGLAQWYPAADTAAAAVRVNDVFSAQPPLTGLPAFPSITSGLAYSYPGALLEYVLAVPVKLLGVSWGLVVGMGLLNTAWFVTAMWLIRRRVGYRLGLIGCCFGATLLWGMGSQMLVDSTPVQACLIAFFAFMFAAWSIADADPKALPVLAVSANFLIQTHLKFGLVVPLMSLVALAAWAWRLRRIRGGDPDMWRSERRRHARSFIASVAVTMIVWIPPVVEQFRSDGGNLGHLLHAATAPSSGAPSRSILDAIGVVSSPIATWPLWFRNSLAHPHFTAHGPTEAFLVEGVGVLIVVAAVLVMGRNVARRRDAAMLSGLILGLVAWFGWTASALLNPDRGGYNPGYFLPLWPLSVFIWLNLAFGVARSGWIPAVRGRVNVHLAVKATAVVGVVAFAAATIPIADLGGNTGTTQERIPTARQVFRGVRDRVPHGGPVLVVSNLPAFQLYLPTALLGLQAAGVPFRISDTYQVRTYGRSRDIRLDSPQVHRQLLLTHDPTTAPPNAHLVVRAGPTFKPAYYAMTKKLLAWAATVTSLRFPQSVDVSADALAAANRTLARYVAEARTAQDRVRSSHSHDRLGRSERPVNSCLVARSGSECRAGTCLDQDARPSAA